MIHTPVLLKEVIAYLNPQLGENFIDATFGGGGHAKEILKKITPGGRLLGLDWDPGVIERVKGAALRQAQGKKGEEKGKEKDEGFGLETRSENLIKSESLVRSGIELEPFKNNLITVHGNFAEIENIAIQYFPDGINGALFDLGLSSDQLEAGGRGFSYLKNEPLDMRFYRSGTSIDAAEIVNTWTEKELEKIFREYGEEKNAKKIARTIAEARKEKRILTAGDLIGILRTNKSYKTYRTYSRIFQALRIAVNNELENISRGLEGAWNILRPGGHLAAISFHSLEDRLVKNFFKERQSAGAGEILTKKPVTPGPEEIAENPRSRSAKLRVIRKRN